MVEIAWQKKHLGGGVGPSGESPGLVERPETDEKRHEGEVV
jgi:hypothetical protein